ncbi:MAG TPA: glycosyltransferase family 9 protein [Burkholderiaceae bacterium]
MSAAFSHILIARTDNIGDLVLTLPLAGFLKQRFPGVRISVVCRAYAAPVVRHSRFVDQVYAVEELGDANAFFAGAGIDTVIFAYPDRRLARAAKRARVPRRVGTSHRLYHWLYCNRLAHFSRVQSELHEAQLNFALLKPLGVAVTPALDQIPQWYGLQAANGHPALEAGKFNLVLHPKSNGNGREWPVAHYAALAALLAADPRIVCLVTGSPAEGGWLATHGAALLAQPNVRNLCGTMDLNGLTELIAAADGLVASGTGPVHMAAALGIRTLGLFPPVKPIHPGRWAPVGPRAEVLCEAQACGQCGDAATCGCMEAITPARVAEVIARWTQS